MAKTMRRLTEAERAERRQRDRERLQRAAQELLTSEGWQRWVRVRAMFHSYSAGNCMLLALQCNERGIVPQRVAGFRAWLKLGRCVRKNEKALRILAPVTVKERDERGEETGERRVFFKTAFVFELSQTEPLPGVEPVSLEPPREPLTGDSHAHLIEPMVAFAASLGFTISFEQIAGSAGGWCDPKHKRIVVDADAPANARLRTLIHECAHALGIDYRSYSRAQAEVMVETVTLLAASTVGLAVDGETIPYVSGWGEDGALEAVTEFAETIDRVARRIEDVLLAASEHASAALARPAA
jgi:antirestriction protein ArdC